MAMITALVMLTVVAKMNIRTMVILAVKLLRSMMMLTVDARTELMQSRCEAREARGLSMAYPLSFG